MPSYRVILTIGALRSGVAPAAVLPAAAAAAAELTTLEASSIALVHGEPRIVVRFTSDDDEIARQIAAAVAATTADLAGILDGRITRLAGARWLTVPPEPPGEGPSPRR